MECGKFSPEEGPAAEEDESGSVAANEEKGVQMVASELEAAEALAGLAGCSAFHGGDFGSGELERRLVTEAAVTSTVPSQDQPKAVLQFCGHASTMVSNTEMTENIVQNIPSEFCSTSCQPNSGNKFRRNLTEPEKEARKLRRILANRESARQTIRRRQALHLELTRKATDLSEENENLKKAKAVAMEKYNSLKSGNKFLKAQLAKAKKPKRAETQEEPTTSQSEKSCPATTSNPTILHDQASIVPCFWPSILPLLDVFQSHCPSHPNFMSLSQLSVPHRQENSLGIAGPGTPLFVFPVPWLLSFLAHSSMHHKNSALNNGQDAHQCSACSCSGSLLCEDNNQLSSNQNVRVEASNSMEDMSCSDVSAISASKGTRNGLLQRNRERIIHSHKKSEDVFAATEARRRRKELMKLKNVHCHPVQRR
ncbi:hypothetical protein CDL12_12672 [Handroanthus impetiginosus]|uniref:BZIP domain-containing protein n=1 Tax=Handroanthus impetiginosus TaxID=429701 RepID=A0A2G9HBM1_9LAMI|nr:hypothetical protein CDL12_12672 [Handroanthus impetiginosus]